MTSSGITKENGKEKKGKEQIDGQREICVEKSWRGIRSGEGLEGRNQEEERFGISPVAT